MRKCPNCNAGLSFWNFATPRLSGSLTCANCSADIRLSGPASFIIGAALLVASYGVYAAIEGNLLEALVLLPLSLFAIFAQYRFAELSVEQETQTR